MQSIYDTIENTARDLYLIALKKIPEDVRRALTEARRVEERQQNKTAVRVLSTIQENIAAADQLGTLVCQDTGLPVYKVRIGSELSLDIPEVKARIRKACESATLEYPLRSNSVHPLTRRNTGTNTGEGLPIIKLEFVPGSDRMELWMAPKGSGSENMSFLNMLNPAEGIKGIRKFVLQCVFESGARPCPPVIVGIGLGGTSDVAMSLAKEASTFRILGSSNPDPEVARLEKELLDLINQTGVGPQGLGGATTAIGVHIEWAHTHISQNPVAVNMQCWRGERAGAVIEKDGTVVYEDLTRETGPPEQLLKIADR